MRLNSSYFSTTPFSRALAGFAALLLLPAFATSATPARAQDGAAQPPAAQSGPPVLTGFWTAYNDDGKPGGIFYFYDDNGLYEGRLVKEITYPEDPPENPLCTHCPGEKKDKPMLGLVIVWGMQKHGDAKYENGHILDPRDGSVWSAQLEVTPDNQKLNLRGYVATPLLGQTRVWTRLPDDTMALADIPGDPIPGLTAPPDKKHAHGAKPQDKKHAHAATPHPPAPQAPAPQAPAPEAQ
ncbi:DUF2147 domain-containing protein [Rhodoblastus sp.]|uniref:DUF2147 domain-containing protein n=1 Tax=Rhodoblastus sp. TaxID=1962975 RepID=UPI003F9C8C91